MALFDSSYYDPSTYGDNPVAGLLDAILRQNGGQIPSAPQSPDATPTGPTFARGNFGSMGGVPFPINPGDQGAPATQELSAQSRNASPQYSDQAQAEPDYSRPMPQPQIPGQFPGILGRLQTAATNFTTGGNPIAGALNAIGGLVTGQRTDKTALAMMNAQVTAQALKQAAPNLSNEQAWALAMNPAMIPNYLKLKLLGGGVPSVGSVAGGPQGTVPGAPGVNPPGSLPGAPTPFPSPAGMSPADAASLTRRAMDLRTIGGNLNLAEKGAGDAYLKQADELDKRAAEARKIQSGAQEDVNKNDIKHGEALFTGITAQAQQYDRDQKPILDLTRGILNTPGIYTGFGANAVYNWNSIKATFGDQKAAQLQDMLKKATATSMLSDINIQKDQMAEAGSQSSRIFSQQVEFVQKAAPQLETSLAGNRALVEMKARLGEFSTGVAQFARDYRTTHGRLDNGFDQELADYVKTHPVFNKQEQNHPELLGAPTVPQDIQHDKKAIQEWGAQWGLKKGDAISFGNGIYRGFEP